MKKLQGFENKVADEIGVSRGHLFAAASVTVHASAMEIEAVAMIEAAGGTQNEAPFIVSVIKGTEEFAIVALGNKVCVSRIIAEGSDHFVISALELAIKTIRSRKQKSEDSSIH